MPGKKIYILFLILTVLIVSCPPALAATYYLNSTYIHQIYQGNVWDNNSHWSTQYYPKNYYSAGNFYNYNVTLPNRDSGFQTYSVTIDSIGSTPFVDYTIKLDTLKVGSFRDPGEWATLIIYSNTLYANDNITINSSGKVQMFNSGKIYGDISNSGYITVNGASGSCFLRDYISATGGTGGLFNASLGFLEVTGGVLYADMKQVGNEGLIRVTGAGSVLSNVSTVNSNWENHGDVELISGGELKGTTVINAASGTITLMGGKITDVALRNFGTLLVRSPTPNYVKFNQGNNKGLVDIDNSALYLSANTDFTNHATVNLANGAYFGYPALLIENRLGAAFAGEGTIACSAFTNYGLINPTIKSTDLVITGPLNNMAGSSAFSKGNLVVEGNVSNNGNMEFLTGSASTVEGGFTLGATGNVLIENAASLEVQHGWDNLSTDNTCVEMGDTGKLKLLGGATTPEYFEVAGADNGNSISNLVDNFAFNGELELASGKLMLVDNFDNPTDSFADALYVRTLTIDHGAQLDLNGLTLYYANYNNLGGSLLLNGGEFIQMIPLPSTLVLLGLGLGILGFNRKRRVN